MINYKEKENTPEELDALLHPLVKKWFSGKFPSYSLPQLYGVLEIHSRKNVLITAPTGATKTLTGFLSVLNELIDSSEKGILENKVYCVYVSPLKALNEDIKVNLLSPLKEMEEIAGKKLGIRVAVRTGDTSAHEKSKMLKNPPHILITTPESLAIVLSSTKFSGLLHDVQWAIIDEVHALAENKRGVHLSLSLERLQKISSAMSRVGLSATIAPLEGVALFLVGRNGDTERDCLIIDVQFIKKMDLKVLSPVPDLIDTDHPTMQKQMYDLIDELVQSHKTTIIFTNTRSATERVVDRLKEKYPHNYANWDSEEEAKAIGAHHGSLSAWHRRNIEQRLREGKLKVVVTSTSLELGIDIGYVDLVILLGSPKSVARAIQRIGRAGHKLGETAKGRIIVLDRDDLIECSVMLKAANERKIDRIHIPTNCLDVLCQHVHGAALKEKTNVKELYSLFRQSYCFAELSWKDFIEVIEYMAGRYVTLQDRHIYAKIWYDEESGMVGRKGKLSRVIHMTNIGTIPDESHIIVKVGETPIGTIDEGFLERLKRGDIFVLGGQKYQFLYARGMTASVSASVASPPTVPSWFSEMLPLSFDLASEIGKFRRLMEEKMKRGRTKEEIIAFINEHLYVEGNAAEAIYKYFREQFFFSQIPTDHKIVIEKYSDEGRKIAVFHALFGRRVNDCLSRAVAFAIGRTEHRDVEVGVTDNGFYIAHKKPFNAKSALGMLKSNQLNDVLKFAIERSEVLRRRFRHCATRSLMILRQYKGLRKRVGRQQVSSMILLNAVRRISTDFFILREARREVLEDLMDVQNAMLVMKLIEEKKIRVEETTNTLPSPFALSIALQGHTDVLRIEDKVEFLRRMHQQILAKIGKKAVL